MLTKLEDDLGHTWVELATVTSVAGDDTDCIIRSPGFPHGLKFRIPGDEMAAMVQEAKAKASARLVISGHVESATVDEAVAQFVADMKSGGGPLMAPAQVSPNAQAFLTPKGVGAISNRVRLVALHDVANMMQSLDQHPHPLTGPWRELHDCLHEEIKAVERKQAETEQDQPEVQKPGGN